MSAGIALLGVFCLGLVTFHVLIAENQFTLDRLTQAAATEQASYEKLRLQVAQLEAPARIVSDAEGRLGLVQPGSVTYLPATSIASNKRRRPRTGRLSPGRLSDGSSGRCGLALDKAVPERQPVKRDVRGNRTRSIWRFCASLALMSAGLGGILARLLFVQGVNAATYQADARSEYVHEFSFLGERGAILDRNGNELAMSVPMTTVFGDPYQVTNPGQEAKALSVALGLPEASLQADLSEPSGFVYLARTVPNATAAKVEKLVNDGAVPGVYTMQEPKQFDPAGQLAAPLIGVVGTDGAGLSGLEYEYNNLLEGKPGKLVEDMDPAGGQIPGGLQEYQAPVRGDDLVLSIDEPLQYDAEQALARAIVAAQANSGIAMIMDRRTGDILAVAELTMRNPSEPTTMSEPPALPVWFVPPGGVPGHGGSVASAQPVEAPSASAFTTVYEPGSVEKLVTVSAALATSSVQPNDYFDVPDPYYVAGSQFTDAWVHPTLYWSIPNIIAHSSDIGTIEVAQRMGMPDLLKYIHAFGMGETDRHRLSRGSRPVSCRTNRNCRAPRSPRCRSARA